jgi:hypothetical protein
MVVTDLVDWKRKCGDEQHKGHAQQNDAGEHNCDGITGQELGYRFVEDVLELNGRATDHRPGGQLGHLSIWHFAWPVQGCDTLCATPSPTALHLWYLPLQ